jgi:dsRNA-specific ribonuclease
VDEERRASLKQLEDCLGHQFTEIKWLDQALTHKSFIYETNHPEKGANEVLEFLGDSVLILRSAPFSCTNFLTPKKEPFP